MRKLAFCLMLAVSALMVWAEPVKIVFDSDMFTDFDDIGALACLHALADAGECEIMATVSSTRGNASVAAIEIINAYYGRPDIPVGAPKEIGVIGASETARHKVDPKSPLGSPDDDEGAHYKYRKLAADYAKWVRHLDADEAPDANRVYRRVLASVPDHSVVICSVGFLTNLRRLLESKGDDLSPLDGRALVTQKVKKWVAMACAYPRGQEYNSMQDWESSKIVLAQWPTPVIFSDFQYGFDVYTGRAVAELPGFGNPVKDAFAASLPSRETMQTDICRQLKNCFGPGGRASWDEVTVLAAVRGEERYFNLHRGTYRMIDRTGENEWIPDETGGLHVRLTEKMNKVEIGKIIDELMCRKPLYGK